MTTARRGTDTEVVKTTCPRDCYDGCGVHVLKRGGEVVKVVGDPDHATSRGTLCAKFSLAYNGPWRDPKARLLHPLRRTGPRGRGSFEAVSWDDALEEIAGRLGALAAEHSPGSILYSHYTGTLSLLAYLFPYRFFFRLGATEVDPDTICNKAGQAALYYTVGDAYSGFDPATVRDSRCVLVWGANPSACAPHVDAHWLSASGARVVCVDPVAHPTAKRADLHLQVRPGADAALAFGMLHVLDADDLVDRAFVRDHVVGWQEVEPAVRAATPERTTAATGVPADLVREAAHLYAEGPSLLWLGQGGQRQRHGGNAVRAVLALCAATGNVGRPGAGFSYLNGPNTRGIDAEYLVAPQLLEEKPASVSHMDLAGALTDPTRFRALLTWNNNVVASSPDQARLRRALEREDLFQVAIDLFPTDTTDYADYVLPAASFLEFDDLVVPYFERTTLSAQVKAQEPLGESLPNQEIFRRLARAMGFAEPELYEPDEALLAVLLGQTGAGLTFEQLAAAGTVRLADEPVVAFADLRFPTPSGKIELASERAERRGLPRTPLPHADDPPADGRLRVLSPASAWTLNSECANDERVARRLGEPFALLHPDEARARGVADGDRVELRNGTGALALVARTSPDVGRGVVVVPKGRWPKRTGSGANVNVLNPGDKADMGESSAVHSVLAELVRLGA